MLKSTLASIAGRLGYEIRRKPKPLEGIPDGQAYCPLFCPWIADRAFEQTIMGLEDKTLVTVDRLHVLYTLARQAVLLVEEFLECRVFRGGAALLLARVGIASNSSGVWCPADSSCATTMVFPPAPVRAGRRTSSSHTVRDVR